MENTRFPGTDLEVSRIALGTWAIGGWMWGGTDEEGPGDQTAPLAIDLVPDRLIEITRGVWRKCMGIEPTYRLRQTAHRI